MTHLEKIQKAISEYLNTGRTQNGTYTLPIDKATEIQVLDLLMHTSSFFADEYIQSDIEQMQSNIRNDFAISMGTLDRCALDDHRKQSRQMQDRITSLEECSKNQQTIIQDQRDHIERLLTAMVSLDHRNCTDHARELFSPADIASMKITLNLDLNEKDKAYSLETIHESTNP